MTDPIEFRIRDDVPEMVAYSVGSAPEHGRLKQFGDYVRYVPGVDYPGEDAFAVLVSDREGQSIAMRYAVYGPVPPPQAWDR